jgi:hypothetical protein
MPSNQPSLDDLWDQAGSSPGLLSRIGSGIMDLVKPVANKIDSYTGAPTRSFVNDVATGKGVSKGAEDFAGQFGDNPEKAPTATDINKNLGVPRMTLREAMERFGGKNGQAMAKVFPKNSYVDKIDMGDVITNALSDWTVPVAATLKAAGALKNAEAVSGPLGGAREIAPAAETGKIALGPAEKEFSKGPFKNFPPSPETPLFSEASPKLDPRDFDPNLVSFAKKTPKVAKEVATDAGPSLGKMSNYVRNIPESAKWGIRGAGGLLGGKVGAGVATALTVPQTYEAAGKVVQGAKTAAPLYPGIMGFLRNENKQPSLDELWEAAK